MKSAYTLADEPLPGGLSHLAVNPVWPFFAVMFGGTWIAWPWYVLNGYAVGSPTRKRELNLVILGFIGVAALIFSIGSMAAGGLLSKTAVPYAFVVPIVWKLGITYWLFLLQSRTFEIYEYYGGLVRNGFLVVIVAAFAGRRLLEILFDAVPFLRAVLG